MESQSTNLPRLLRKRMGYVQPGPFETQLIISDVRCLVLFQLARVVSESSQPLRALGPPQFGGSLSPALQQARGLSIAPRQLCDYQPAEATVPRDLSRLGLGFWSQS